MLIDKPQLVARLIATLESELAVLQQAAAAAHAAATADDAKPENKYDTRSVEASYLAGAQARRAFELAERISLFRQLKLPNYGPDQPIANGALVQLVSATEETAWYFTAPVGGGLSVEIDGQRVLVVTPESPLGQRLFRAKLHDMVELPSRGRTKEYSIVGVA